MSEPIHCQGSPDGETAAVAEADRRVETAEYAAMMRRMLAGWGRRLADCDIEDLAELVAYERELRNTIREAVLEVHERGASWAEIARAFGTTRQTVWERFGR